jgi:hypothetical protein
MGRHLWFVNDDRIDFLGPVEHPVPGHRGMWRGEPGTVEVKTGGEPTEPMVSGLGEVVGERSAWYPAEQHAPALAGHARGSGVYVAAPVGCGREAAHVEVCVTGERIQPREFDADVAIRVVLMEVDTQGVRPVIGVDTEDHIGESAHQLKLLRIDGELSQCGQRQRAKTPDLSSVCE